jgi:hypothetical protein
MSRQVSISVPDEFYATLESEYAKRKEVDPEASFSSVVRSMIEASLSAPVLTLPFNIPDVAWKPPMPEPTLDDAAEMLLKELPESQVDLIRQMCMDNEQRPVRYLISYAVLAHERGETSYMIGGDDIAPLQAQPFQPKGTVSCEWCKQSFIPTRQGQKFCPPPDEDTVGCGRLAAEAEWHTKRPPDLDRQRQIALSKGFLPSGKIAEVVQPQAAIIAQAVAEALRQIGMAPKV